MSKTQNRRTASKAQNERTGNMDKDMEQRGKHERYGTEANMKRHSTKGTISTFVMSTIRMKVTEWVSERVCEFVSVSERMNELVNE